FGSMVLAQARRIEGYHIVAVADLQVEKVRASFARTGWQEDEYSATSMAEAMDTGKTYITSDSAELCAFEGIECIIEATGHPLAGVRHALKAIDGNKHL